MKPPFKKEKLLKTTFVLDVEALIQQYKTIINGRINYHIQTLSLVCVPESMNFKYGRLWYKWQVFLWTTFKMYGHDKPFIM